MKYIRHVVIFLNGKPRVGKDEFATMMLDFVRTRLGGFGAAHSSIDGVRHMLINAGIYNPALHGKSERARKLLADVGDAVEEFSGFKSRGCVDLAFREGLVYRNNSYVTIFHIREKDMIQKVEAGLKGLYSTVPMLSSVELVTKTVLITSTHRGERSSLSADKNTGLISYDYTIENNSTLDDLRDEAELLANELLFR